MSMNLKCNYVELWPTPTWVTFMCVIQPDGATPHILTGDKARQSLHIYMEWVKGTLNGTYLDEKSLVDAKLRVTKHMKSLVRAFNMNRSRLEVTVV